MWFLVVGLVCIGCFNLTGASSKFIIKYFLNMAISRWMFIFFLMRQTVKGNVSYSLPEETKSGFVIGNIAKDLNMDSKTLSTRNARIDVSVTRKRYCDISLSTGDLIVAESMDRESLCGLKTSCVIRRDIVLENPLELHSFTLHVQDINDNSPRFKEDLIEIEISESADRGARYVIEEARKQHSAC